MELSSSRSSTSSSIGSSWTALFSAFSLCQYFIQICEFCTFFFFIASFTLTKNSISASGSLNSRRRYRNQSGPWSSSDESRSSGFRLSWIIIGIVRMRLLQFFVIRTRADTTPVLGFWKSWNHSRTVFHPTIRELSAREM